jgi:hypothetical protein
MELPESRSGSRSQTPANSSGFRPVGGVRRASYEEEIPEDDGAIRVSEPSSPRSVRRVTPVSATTGRHATSVPATSRYGHDSEYTWLRGKLEHSQVEGRWKLRYIPIDGDTDDFGGSVILLGTRMLEEYQPGEFVTVYGSLADQPDGRSFAPPYQLERIEPQSARR